MVDLDSDTGATASEAPVEALQDINEESPTAEAVDIDTDELESLFIDLKATKNKIMMPAKKRERKQKVVAAPAVEDATVVAEPVCRDTGGRGARGRSGSTSSRSETKEEIL